MEFAYSTIIFTKHQNWRKDWRESRNLKNDGFIGSVKKLYIKYRDIKINLIENKKRKTDDKCDAYFGISTKLVFI